MGELDPLVRRWKESPVLRALAELLGSGGALNELMAQRVEEIDQERLRTLFDELASGARPLDQATIASEDFLHCYFATVRAVRVTRQRQKIRYFGRLLAATFEPAGAAAPVDRFERYLGILEDLTYEEVHLLTILARHEKASKTTGNPFLRVCAYWDEMIAEATSTLALPRAIVESLFTRVERTGLYQGMTGVWVTDDIPRGTLTPLYEELSVLVSLRTS